MRFTIEEKIRVRSCLTALLDTMVNLSQIRREQPTITAAKFMKVQTDISTMSYEEAIFAIRTMTTTLDLQAVKELQIKNEGTVRKAINPGMILVNKQDLKDIFGTLGDFDLNRIVEEAEDCAPEVMAKYRALEEELYDK